MKVISAQLFMDLLRVCEDTEKVKGSSYIYNGVPQLWLLPRGELDDFLGCLQKLRHPCPGAVTLWTLQDHNAANTVRCFTFW